MPNKHIFDAKYIKKHYGGPNLKVDLKKGPKGISLYAKKPIKKGNIIAYYKFKVFKSNHKGVKGDMYSMSVYTKGNRFNDRVIGDIYDGSARPPKYNIPFWGYFSNEPSKNQKENATIDINLKGNYKNRSRIKPGDTMVYKLIASRNIKPGEEIVWCYGDSYFRDYPSSCE